MRRIVPLLAATLILGIAALPARAQVPVAAYGMAEQLADAAWISKENGEKVFYFAMAGRGADAFVLDGLYPSVQPNGWGVVGRGECISSDGWTFCSASGSVRELEPGNFEFDPVLSSAYMKLERGTEQHEVFWTGEGELIYPGFGISGGLAYAGVGVGAARWASVEGTVFGKPITSGRTMFGALYEGAQMYAEAFVGGRGYVFHDNGTVTLRVRFPNG